MKLVKLIGTRWYDYKVSLFLLKVEVLLVSLLLLQLWMWHKELVRVFFCYRTPLYIKISLCTNVWWIDGWYKGSWKNVFDDIQFTNRILVYGRVSNFFAVASIFLKNWKHGWTICSSQKSFSSVSQESVVYTFNYSFILNFSFAESYSYSSSLEHLRNSNTKLML